MSGSPGVSASQVVSQANQDRTDVYNHVDPVANFFINNNGTLYPWNDAVSEVASSVGISKQMASRAIVKVVDDVVDPVSMVSNSNGKYVGVVSYNERDFYYEFDEFHDIHGEITKGVCAPCVEEATFDHQVVSFPDYHQYNKQHQSNAVIPGEGTTPRGATGTERRRVLGGHYLTVHTSVTPGMVVEELGLGVDTAANDFGVRGDNIAQKEANLNEEVSVADVMGAYSINFDQIKNSSIDTGVSDVVVGASLVSGTTIAGNTAVHGGNQSNFNVEGFGTSGADGEVPTSDGAGNLVMEAPGGGSSVWTEDGNSPLSMSSSSSSTYTLANTWDLVKCIIVNDSSSTAGAQMDLQVNGVTSGYDTRLWNGSTSSDPFVKGIFHTGFGDGFVMDMAGTWGTNWSCGITGGGDSGNGTKATAGSHTGVSSPLSQFTVMDDAANNASITMRVFGLNQ